MFICLYQNNVFKVEDNYIKENLRNTFPLNKQIDRKFVDLKFSTKGVLSVQVLYRSNEAEKINQIMDALKSKFTIRDYEIELTDENEMIIDDDFKTRVQAELLKLNKRLADLEKYVFDFNAAEINLEYTEDDVSINLIILLIKFNFRKMFYFLN